MRRLLYVCLDGLADDPVPELGDRTPLEAARTPFLDSLARQGRTGVVTTVGPGIAPESDIAVFAILGYDPREEHPGRGVVEAIGSGVGFEGGDLAYRVNFATGDGGDRRPELQPIRERFGPSWGCFVEMPVERGIAILLGMAPVDVPRLAAEVDYERWAGLAVEALDGYDALYVHIKGPDVPAHDGRAEGKRDIIETIDRAFFGEVLRQVDLTRTVLAVTADHATSCLRKAHTAEPVPLVVAGGGAKADGVRNFGERAALDGSLGRLRGTQIVPR